MAQASSTKVKRTRVELIQQQADLYTAPDQYRWLMGIAGEQGGKTSNGIRWLFNEITRKHWDKPYNWIIGAPSYKILSQATIGTFLKKFTPLWGTLNRQQMDFQLKKNGQPWGKIFFRSATDPDSGVGIPECKGGLMDEAGKCSRNFFYMFQGRLARLGGRLYMCTTPYALNWVKKEVIDVVESGKPKEIADSIMYRRWASFENPSYPKAEADRLKATLPQRVYNMRVLGLHEKAEGLIHDAWGELNYVPSVPENIVPTYIAGLDWGFDHPLSIVILGCYGQTAIIESVTKIRHLGPDSQKQLILAKHALFKPKLWGAGHDQPGMIAELSSAIPIQKYFQTLPQYREINPGNQKVSELIQLQKLKIKEGIDGLSDFEDEIETYRWDRDDEEEARDKPVDQNDDIMAALRYAVITALSMGLLKEEKFVIVDTRQRTAHDLFKPRKKISDWTDL